MSTKTKETIIVSVPLTVDLKDFNDMIKKMSANQARLKVDEKERYLSSLDQVTDRRIVTVIVDPGIDEVTRDCLGRYLKARGSLI